MFNHADHREKILNEKGNYWTLIIGNFTNENYYSLNS